MFEAELLWRPGCCSAGCQTAALLGEHVWTSAALGPAPHARIILKCVSDVGVCAAAVELSSSSSSSSGQRTLSLSFCSLIVV